MYFHIIITCIPLFLAFFTSLNTLGYDGVSRKKRMVGGAESNESTPYAVNILMKNKTQLCTGMIIHQSYILTAAQCIDKDGILVSVANAEVKHKNTFCHDAFLPGKISKYDLALIELETALTLDNKTIGVLPLSDRPWSQVIIDDEEIECSTVGFGATNMNETSNGTARTMFVKPLHGDHACGCLRSFQNRRVICLTDETRALCKGDMGAPLVCDGFGVGVAHARYNPKNCQRTNVGFNGGDCSQTQSVYMYICPHLDWIRKTVPGIPKTPKSCRATVPTLTAFLTLIIAIVHFF